MLGEHGFFFPSSAAGRKAAQTTVAFADTEPPSPDETHHVKPTIGSRSTAVWVSYLFPQHDYGFAALCAEKVGSQIGGKLTNLMREGASQPGSR